jgi:transposase-like protein
MKRRGNSVPGFQKYSIADLHTEFPNDDACLDYIKEQRWPDGIAHCEKCKADRKHYRVSGRTAYACDHCGNHIYPLAGTIFEKSTTDLRIWFHAMFLMGSTRCGVSAKQIQRETGVTYKTAWRMFKQIRTLMSEDISLEGSTIEMDEMYVGGKRKNKHVRKTRGMRGRKGYSDEQTPVFGMVERGGRVVAKVTPDVKIATIYPIVHEYVMPASTVYTDEYSIYDRLATETNGYVHHRIKHAERVYVMGDVHTQTIEGFWSLVKRGIGGVYHSVSRKYLQTYLDECAFRYNRRNANQPMFVSLLEQVALKAE